MDITAFALSQLFTELIGRKVQVVEAGGKPASTAPASIGVYMVHPGGSAIVIRIDTMLLGALGGALAGIPEALVREEIASGLGELLLDAMHEVLNVASSALGTGGRAVLSRMVTDRLQAEAAARAAFARAHVRARFSATISGYPGGDIALYAVPAS
jgi:hypothetical protein